MGFRSRVGDTLVRVGKTFGSSVPESFREGEAASQMTPASPFSPGQPIGPYDGYDRFPRQRDFVTGYNIAARPRLHERVSFETLKGLIGAYDVASICLWHRIDSIRSLDWRLISADHWDGDVTDAIPVGLAALEKPDRENYFDTWLARWAYDILAYDAGALYRLRNRAGRAVGLMPVDGTTVAPLLDYWGRSPKAAGPGEPEPEAFVQYANGLPWNWLTRSDLIYTPFRPHNDSIYGQPPIETIILNANTDIRFQVYFLQRFTEGNLPAAFASAPDTWSPDQIEQFQQYWDAAMYGQQDRKHQVRWMPPGSKFVWSNERDFSDVFSLFMMRKTAAAFHVVPADIGFTENVNRSSGESQADVQHRVGDLPLIRFLARIITGFLQNDLGLPLKFTFDLGEEQEDRLALAQADDIYIKNGTVSASHVAEMRFGRADPRPVPRYIFTTRSGPIPLNSLEAVAGQIDPQTAMPASGAELPRQVFEEAPGVQPNPPLFGQPLAEEIYGPKAIPPHTEGQGLQQVTKDGEAGPAAGITAETGVYSYDLVRDDEDEQAVAKELAAFGRFTRTRRKAGEWRDFRFDHVPAGEARRLNAEGRATVAKDAAPGQPADGGKVSKESVDYRLAEGPARCCGTCSMIRPAGDGYACTLVEGRIDPGAVCDEWDPADGTVAKAVTSGPKVPAREHPGPEPAWGEIEDRRAKLTRKHLRAVLAAWNDLTAGLDSRHLVREYRAGSASVAKYADPQRNRAYDLALGWLSALALTSGWAVLTAAIAEAIRAAEAEGRAGALALAAGRQKVPGFRIGPAYDAAYADLADDADPQAQADDTARKMLEGTAAAVSGVLAASDGQDEAETAGAVDDTVTGNDVQPVTTRVSDLIWGAIGAGIVWLAGRANSGTPPEPPPGVTPPPVPPTPPVPPSPVLINWVTDGNPCPRCVDNEAGSPYATQDVPPFPQHPRCKCELVPVGGIPAAFFAG